MGQVKALSKARLRRLEPGASRQVDVVKLIYPYWHQEQLIESNPLPVYPCLFRQRKKKRETESGFPLILVTANRLQSISSRQPHR
jgi:hypothetical protein